MASFWTVLLVLVMYSTSIKASGNLLKNTFPEENRLAECLFLVTHDPSLALMSNIRIRIETEAEILRREFMNTAGRFMALNDRFAIDLSTAETESFNTHVRLYFVDSRKSLEVLIKQQRQQDTDLSGERQYYLIVLSVDAPNRKRVLRQIFQLCWDYSIVNVNVLVEDGDASVTLYTYYPFTQRSCKDRTPTLHNRFVNGSLALNRTIFPPKSRNLWQCRVRWILCSYPPFVVIDGPWVYGTDVDMVRSLSYSMNFTLETVGISDSECGEVYSSTNFTGGFKMIHNGMADFMVQLCDKAIMEQFATTNAFDMSEIHLIVKRSKKYTPLEILLFPFDWYTWMGFLVLCIGKSISQLLRRRVSNNLVSLSVNFTRLCLALWLISILILKSSYEGSVFGFLNTRPGRDPPKNLDDAIDRGYKFIVLPAYYDSVSQIPEIRGKLTKFGESIPEAFEYLERVEGNYGIFLYEEHLHMLAVTDKYQNFIVIRDRILSSGVCVYLRKFSYLATEIDEKLKYMNANGEILKVYNKEEQRALHRRRKKRKAMPGSMTLKHLEGAFQLFLILIAAIGCVFVVELLSKYSSRLRRMIEFFQ